MAMPGLRPDCVEKFATLFWKRDCYTAELQQYQRIAVLFSLDSIHSSLLPQYLEWAKKDGRRYLMEYAKEIERRLALNEKLFRTKFDQMETTEKQALMESLAARYDITFLGLHLNDGVRAAPLEYSRKIAESLFLFPVILSHWGGNSLP